MSSYYFTFPIQLLKVQPSDSEICIKNNIDDAFSYCLYSYVHSENDNVEVCAKEFETAASITFSNLKNAIANGEQLFKSIPVKSPKTSISKGMMFDFFKNDKSEFEIICFIAFAAIRSILQMQPYVKITNDYLIGRMSGNSKKGEEVSCFIEKYNNRYQLDKIKNELQHNWGLKLYARHTRGFYVSFTLSIEKLIYHAELKRKSYRDKELKRKKEGALQAALKMIDS